MPFSVNRYTSQQGQRGLALIIVLWMVTLLSVIASSFAFNMRSDLLLARNQLSSAQAQALADAGIQRAMYELAKPVTDRQRWVAGGTRREFELAGAKIAVTVLDESGKIDLNAAPETLLKSALGAAGLAEAQSAAVLDAILDWRDKDSLKRPLGAEDEEYRSAGLKFRPANSPFETVEELQHVIGVSPGLYAKIAGMLTVYSRLPGINPAYAPREVLRAIPNLDPAQLEAYLVQRRQNLESGLPPPPFPVAASYLSQSSSQVMGLRAEARLADGTVFIREAVVKASQEKKRPYLILRWGEGASAGQDALIR